MFKFLKEKLSKAVSIFSKKVEEEADIKEEEKEILEPRKHERAETRPAPKAKPEQKKVEEKKSDHERHETPEESEKEKFEEPPREDEDEKARAEEKKVREAGKRRAAVEQEKEEEEKEAHEKRSFLQRLFHHEKKDERKEPEKEAEREKAGKTKEEKSEEADEEEEKEAKKEVRKETEGEVGKKTEEAKERKPARTVKPESTKPTIREEEEISRKHSPVHGTDSSPEPEEKKGFFAKIKETLTTVKLSDEKFEKLFWELELAMLENNVAVEVIEKIKEDLRIALTTGKVSRKGIDELIHDSLKESIESLFTDSEFNLIDAVRTKRDKPFIISFIGVNGSGKTTTMAKLASLLMRNNISVVFAASDTFRAAAIQQLQEHADRLGIKMIKHDYESDPAAVAFDAVKHAKAKGIDVVLIDTAGRLHSNDNLMNELKKLVRVNKPDLKVFVGESITGNDCVEQAKLFNEAVGIDVIILAKADVDEKGGAAISVSFVTKKPIIYLGTGQRYDDLTEFRPELILQNIGL